MNIINNETFSDDEQEEDALHIEDQTLPNTPAPQRN
jgi:hypothetical protein